MHLTFDGPAPTPPDPFDLWDWQDPESFVASIACSHLYDITDAEDLTVTFTNMREMPISDLPSSVSIPETQLSIDGDFYCVS